MRHIHYKVHYKIIEAISNIYQEDHTKLQLGDINKEMKIHSGIRQGCTGSTILFRLITYMIITELNDNGTGFTDEEINIKSLFFADDGLLLAQSIEDATDNLKIVTRISKEFGLDINKEKSNMMIFNMKQQPHYSEDRSYK